LAAVALALIALLFAACSTPPAVDLNNTRWTLIAINGHAIPAGVTATIQFTDGKVGGSAGCNSYGGQYRLEGNRLVSPSPIASTLMACEDIRMTLEQTFLTALGSGVRVAKANGQLTLTGDNGTVLTFRPQ